jgi:hypothetical protein
MATPIMTHAELRRWLDGNWALFFSHPDDFACRGFEADRWQVVLQEAFGEAGVRPVAAFDERRPAFNGWVTDVGGTLTRLASVHAARIREATASASCRVVAILDESLQTRRLFAYSPALQLPSPLDLVATARRLRGVGQQAPHPAAEPLIQQLWRGAVDTTAGVMRAMQLDAVLLLACHGLLGIAGTVDQLLMKPMRDGLQHGLPARNGLNDSW